MKISKPFCLHTSQGVCPWNTKFSRPATEDTFTPRPELATTDPEALVTMDDVAFEERFADTARSRAERAALAPNTSASNGIS